MSMTEWAKREVEIASKRERGDKPESEWDYGCACYDSALKAFESLCGDGHSGFSIGITKGILNRLIDGKPLTPIEDIEDVWNVCSRGENGGVVTYQCKRMSSLFKDVYPDGTVKYHDNDRYYCIKWDDPNLCWHNGFIGKIYSEMFPLTMPYMPSNKADVIVCDELLTDRKNGDFDGYLWKITDEMKQAVLNKIRTVNNACKTGIPPEKDDSKCTYCRYKNECALVDAGKWVHPNPPEKPQTAKKDTNRKKATGKKKKASTGQNTALRAVCGNCEHCGRELGAYYCSIDKDGSMYVDRRKKCKFTPSRFKGVQDGK